MGQTCISGDPLTIDEAPASGKATSAGGESEREARVPLFITNTWTQNMRAAQWSAGQNGRV